MARRLEGQVFYTGYNNGVQALAHESVVRNMELVNKIASWHDNPKNGFQDYDRRRVHVKAALEALGHIPTKPIFTFAGKERAEAQPWFTGDTYDLDLLLKYLQSEGARIGTGLYVPFSNGAEMGIHGIEAMQSELGYVTTRSQFKEVFGISMDELCDLIARSV